jgi:hypothetical protein
MWSTRVVILCGHKSYFVGRIRISLGLKIQSEPVRRNPFKPKFVHPFNPWPDPLPPNIQFLLSVMSDSDRFGKSCPPLLCMCTLATTGKANAVNLNPEKICQKNWLNNFVIFFIFISPVSTLDLNDILILFFLHNNFIIFFIFISPFYFDFSLLYMYCVRKNT